MGFSAALPTEEANVRGATRIVWSVLIVLAGVVPAARAEDHVGRSHRLRLPPGFALVAEADVAGSPAGRIDLVGRVAPPTALERRVYVAGPLQEPDAMLVVARIDVDPDQFAASRVRHRYVLDRLRLDPDRFEALVAEGQVRMRPTEIGGYDAIEMTHPGAEGPLGVLEPAGAAVLVDAGTYVIVVSLMVRDTTVYPVEETWARVRGSLVLDPPAVFMRTLLLYGGIGLGCLILLVLLVRIVSSRRPRAEPRYEGAGVLSMTSEGWGGSRPSMPSPMQPMLSTSDDHAVHLDQPVPAPQPAPRPAADLDLEEPDEAPAPNPLRVAEPAEAPPPLPATQAKAAPPPLPGAGARAKADEGAPAKRKGLRPTLPASGRYSG